MTFHISGLETFFHYNHVTRCSLHKLPSEDMALLQRIVGEQNTRDALFDPSDLYITHHPQQAFKLQYEKDVYEINFNGTFNGGWGSKIRHSYQPIARIIFEVPRSIDDALDAIWEWKRFFSQLAMADLSVTAIAFYGTEESFGGDANVYLPNAVLPYEGDANHARLHPGDIPLNLWEDRDRLKEATASWLSRNNTRQQFRCLVNWVLKKMEQRVSPDDIVTLCSAIESLEELAPESLPSKKDVKVLVEGAMKAADAAKLDIQEDRICGLLNLLRIPSLPTKLKLLIERVYPHVSKEDAQTLIANILKIRKVAAHGDFLHETAMPLVGPTTEALAGVCVLFDLLSCGIPVEAKPHSLIYSAQKVKQALSAMKNPPI